MGGDSFGSLVGEAPREMFDVGGGLVIPCGGAVPLEAPLPQACFAFLGGMSIKERGTTEAKRGNGGKGSNGGKEATGARKDQS
jgi:hypothetical protein